jgi:formamidopyrimidine-DNA glycosylase
VVGRTAGSARKGKAARRQERKLGDGAWQTARAESACDHLGPSPSESDFYTQYVALRSQDNPGKNGWKPALLDLASRFITDSSKQTKVD